MGSANEDSTEDTKASSRRTISNLLFQWEWVTGRRAGQVNILSIKYRPLEQEKDGTYPGVQELAGHFFVQWEALPHYMQRKFEIWEEIVRPAISSYAVNLGGTSLTVQPEICSLRCDYNATPPTTLPNLIGVSFFLPTTPSTAQELQLQWGSFSRSKKLVLGNIANWVKQQAWADLANRIRAATGQPVEDHRVHKAFISYKHRSKAERVAEDIAHRLHKENIGAWFDKWEIKAGDSVPGKIGEGFKDCDACLIFLDTQYSSSDWCTKEMNTALTKAIEEGFTVIPVMVESCERPELLKDLSPVYLIDPTATEFEEALAAITDAIYKVDLNPYR